MSQLFDFLRNLLNQTSIRKRRIVKNAIVKSITNCVKFSSRSEAVNTEGPPIPKYRRVSNHFPRTYPQRADDDPYQKVKLSQEKYNEYLEDYVMEHQKQQQKQMLELSGEEFSDEEDLYRKRETRRITNAQPTTSSYNYTFRQSSSNQTPMSYNFIQEQQQQKSESSYRKNRESFFSNPFEVLKSREMPELVPIANSTEINVANGFNSNGYGIRNNNVQRRERSIFDFKKRNRAINDSPNFKFSGSVLSRNHDLEIKKKYENLLRTVTSDFQFKKKISDTQKSSMKKQMKALAEPIATVDLSSDDTETSGGHITKREPPELRRFSSIRNSFDFKKPEAYFELSDDENEPFGSDVLSSTRFNDRKKDYIDRNRVSDHNNQSQTSFRTSTKIPEITPVNSLKERQGIRDCMQDDVIQNIIDSYTKKKKEKDSRIQEEINELSRISKDTTEHEKLLQRRLDEAITSLDKCIIIDEEDDVADEFPALSRRELQTIQFGLHGPRDEVLISKFNMNITRLDLHTLDGLNWLNDEVINFYMELIKERSQKVEYLPKVHVMNTFFIGQLLKMGYSGVRRWTRKVDIFAHDIIPIPVHVGGVHWCMAIIHMRNKTIRYYDSMGHPNNVVLQALEQYLKDESMDKKKVAFDTSDWSIESISKYDIPQQQNSSDCGVFSCMFAEFICRDSKITFEQKHMHYFRQKMVFEIVTGELILK
ncbi:CLUMA_CG004678, isoform A [Clunio marinus]|uniref:CLUMA_CG004678, isoform A n=1 Tax=Clunio marinus TaxID=568069 RepID=A0A1J1HWT5_9DIPT|nr:CLUMA_CG004678, isoform A [Clunio marinus]